MQLLNRLILISLLLLTAAVCAKTLKVLIIDTGLDFSNKELTSHVLPKWQKPEWIDRHGHGTHVAGIILNNACSNVEIIPCWYYENTGLGNNNLARERDCIALAIKERVDIINFSGGGDDPDRREQELIGEFVRRGGTFVAAAGNESNNLDLHPYYPACYKYPNCSGRIIAVGSLDQNGRIAQSSNFANWIVWQRGMFVESWLPGGRRGTMSGTSQACANETNELVLEWCKKNGQENIKRK